MINYKVVRTFHSVGQGAFYSERHDNFNVVYDCGAIPVARAKTVVQSAFSKKDDIDILFISHFDYDHVSAIATLLKTVGNIKRVVLPLLDEGHKNLLININRALSQNIIKLISNPQSFFGKSTEIIYVRPANDEQNEVNNDSFYDLREIPYYKDKKSGKIEVESGSRLGIGGQFRWVFVPYNYLNKTRSSQLTSELNKAGFNVNSLQNDSTYTLNKVIIPASRRALKQVYSRVDGNVNENSMLLYSGPEKSNDDGRWCMCDDCYDDCTWPRYCIYKAGCIYTGDCDLNRIDLGIVYSNFVLNVGVIQIPHHGSKHNFLLNSLLEFWPHIFCPMSFGTKNKYGHPAAQVINDLSQHGFRPLLINENPASEFVQKIQILDKKAKLMKCTVGSF
jgi:beta-lactamase superfamily II metal-dependent hydrolase